MNLQLLWRRFLYGWDQAVPCTVLSRHRTHRVLAKLEFPFSCVINMGYGDFSGLPVGKALPDRKFTLINPPHGCRNAADKLLMKHCFTAYGIPTAEWFHNPVEIPLDYYPLVAKHRMGSRGTGVYLLRTQAGLLAMQASRGRESFLNNFIVERYHRYAHEFRIHATQEEAFYCNRKALKSNTPDYRRWKYTYADSVWLREDHQAFHKPANWDEICHAATRSVRAVGLDMGACDIKVDPLTNKFFIIEINSAPSFGDLTAEKYLGVLPALARRIHQSRPPYRMA